MAGWPVNLRQLRPEELVPFTAVHEVYDEI
jgi:hypothetical protein